MCLLRHWISHKQVLLCYMYIVEQVMHTGITDHVRRVSFNFNPYKKNIHDSNSSMFKLIQTQSKNFTLISSISFLSNYTIPYHDAMLILDFSKSYNFGPYNLDYIFFYFSLCNFHFFQSNSYTLLSFCTRLV